MCLYQILENSSKNFLTHPIFSKISVFWILSQIDFWMRFPEIDLCHARKSINTLIWMSFPEIGLAHTPEICQQVLRVGGQRKILMNSSLVIYPKASEIDFSVELRSRFRTIIVSVGSVGNFPCAPLPE